MEILDQADARTKQIRENLSIRVRKREKLGG
jgi:hypothetical protein